MDAMHHPAQGLLVGAAHLTINPRPGVPLVGYPNDRPNTGVEYGLFARAAVFGSLHAGQPEAALLVLDTLGTSASFVAELRSRAARELPGLASDALMVAATHTHSAPTLDPLRKGLGTAQADPQYLREVLEISVEALRNAWQAREHMLVRVGRAEARLSHNRRVVDAAGVATNEWLDPQGLHRGYCNPNLRFLAFHEAVTGHPRLLLSCYGCHPVVLGPRNAVASADYPGWMIRALEAETGAAAIHITGAAANINPREALFAEAELARPMGEALARALLEALPSARRIDASSMGAHRETLELTLGPAASQNYTARDEQSRNGRTVTSEIQVLRLGDMILLGAPGELFAEIGAAIEQSSPFAHTFVAGYANDNLGYLCTEAAIREGGYEARTALSENTECPIFEAACAAMNAVKSAKYQGSVMV